MKRHEIAILVDDKKTAAFLENFYEGRNGYRPHYFKAPALFLEHVRGNPPAAMLISGIMLADV